MSNREMDDYEKQELDKLTPEAVALQLHVARRAQEKIQSESNILYNTAQDLKRKAEKAEQLYQDTEYDVQEASRTVRNLEAYLNGRI